MAAECSGAVNKNRKLATCKVRRVRIKGCIRKDVTLLSWDPWCQAHNPSAAACLKEGDDIFTTLKSEKKRKRCSKGSLLGTRGPF